jgi:hypothetical protein
MTAAPTGSRRWRSSREMEPPPEKRAMLDDGCKEGGGKKRRPAKDKI